MAYRFEDLVSALNAAGSPFALASDMPEFQQGMTDLLNRLHALEAAEAARATAVGPDKA